ncbi:MAG TPA: alpha/beta hydrolase [Ktedonobacteraceae bacterium]|nr:alpha/beta hydrolase [Ktedonobacteraceae bacterium]
MRTSLPAGHIVSLQDMQMYYVDAGEGEPLLLLHGYTGASSDWAFCFDELARQYRLIIPDLRGHGRSTNPAGEYTQRQAARDVWALLDHLGIKRFQGIGASGGGNILLHLATQQPERVEAMVLMSAVPSYPEQACQIMRSFTWEQVSEEERQRLRKRHPRGDEQIQELFRLGRAFAEQEDDMNLTTSSLATIIARTLIIFGDRDPFYPVSIALDLYQAIPSSYLWIVPNGGHVPELHAPFVPSLLPFLCGSWKRE